MKSRWGRRSARFCKTGMKSRWGRRSARFCKTGMKSRWGRRSAPSRRGWLAECNPYGRPHNRSLWSRLVKAGCERCSGLRGSAIRLNCPTTHALPKRKRPTLGLGEPQRPKINRPRRGSDPPLSTPSFVRITTGDDALLQSPPICTLCPSFSSAAAVATGIRPSSITRPGVN
jgi:hypothetical protein